MTAPVLEDMLGNKFTENDYVIFADQRMSLRIAKIRGIKTDHATSWVALEIVEGLDIVKRRYTRRYYPHDFYKVDYTP